MERQNIKINLIFFIIICLTTLGCTGGSAGGVESNASMAMERFDRALAGYMAMSKAERDSVREIYEPVVDFRKALSAVTDPDTLMMVWSISQAVKVFQPDIEARLTDLSEIERQLGVARDRSESRMPGMSFPRRVIGIVLPYDQSVVVVDTIVLVGLNHYLGADYEGYAGFDDYRRQLKEPARMAYDIVEAAVRTSYPFEADGHSTVASRLAYEGAVAKAVEQLIPGGDVTGSLGYTPEQMSSALADEQMIWRYLAAEGRLYSLDQTMGERLVAPAPYTMIGGRQVPGRIGRLVGYRLVDSYLKNNSDVSVDEILSSGIYSADDFVVKSGYGGR